MHCSDRRILARFIGLALGFWVLSNAWAGAKESVYSKLSEKEQELANTIKQDLGLLRNHLNNASGKVLMRLSKKGSDGVEQVEQVTRASYFGNVQDSKMYLRVDKEFLTPPQDGTEPVALKPPTHTIMTPDGAMSAKVMDGHAIVTSLMPPGHSGDILVEPFFQAATYVTYYKAEDWIFTPFGDVKEASLTSGVLDDSTTTPSLTLKAIIALSSGEFHLRIRYAGMHHFAVKDYEIRKKFPDSQDAIYAGEVELVNSKDSFPSIRLASRGLDSKDGVSKTTIEFESMTPGAVPLEMFKPEAIGIHVDPRSPNWRWLAMITAGIVLISCLRGYALYRQAKTKPKAQ